MIGEKKYTKVKIFLFLVFMMLAFIYIAQTWKFFQSSAAELAEENRKFRCLDLNFRIEPVSYRDKTLVIEVMSKDYDTNISALTVEPDTGGNISVPVAISGGESQIVRIENITISEYYSAYANDCNGSMIKVGMGT